LHPEVLLLRSSTKFHLIDILVPVKSPVQPTLNTVGAASLYPLLVVIGTSIWRRNMRRVVWRKLHYLVFPAAILMFIHKRIY
jgi:methionine sulfoxide reductase heme-binding subunit